MLLLLAIACSSTADAPPIVPAPPVDPAPPIATPPTQPEAHPSPEPDPTPPQPSPPATPEPVRTATASDSVPATAILAPFERAQLPEPSESDRPSRIRPGVYECKIAREYRFRPCTIALDEHGRTILTIPHALLELQGVLTDEGSWTHFDGIKTAERPFGCFSCQERCTTNPGSCGCQELPRVASAQCLLEPVRFRFRKQDGKWQGRIEHHHYYGDLDAEGQPVHETERFVFVMRRSAERSP